MLFDQTFKNIKRAREIIAILFKYGFEDVVINTPLKSLMTEKRKLKWKRDERSVFETSRWERLRMAVEELGPTFIKGAQVLSNRPDILPAELLEEFEKLQSEVPPFDFEIVQKTIEQQTGKTIDQLFAYFNEKPLGSASIGQVHAARLKNGKEVVVKVQRPRVDYIVETDIAIMKEVVRRGESFFEQQGITNPMDVIEAFDKSMQKELDYTNEARNITQFRNFYSDRTDFYVPMAYKEHSTKKVLVLEFIKGCKVTDVKQLKQWNIDPKEIAERGMNIYLTQIFEFGFFHADPHPGNIIVRKDGTICLIDFGMVGRLMKRDKFAFAGVFIDMAQQNARGMANNLRKLAIDDNIEDMQALEYELYEIIQDYTVLDVSESSMAELANRLQKLVYDYQIRVPGGVFIILRALAILEGIGKTVHPDLNTFEYVKPFGRKLILEQYSEKNIADVLSSRAINIINMLDGFPIDVRDILTKVKKGRIHSSIELKGWEPILQKIDYITNRLIMAILICALLIASGIMMNAGAYAGPATSGGLPYFSIIGLSFAGVLFMFLIISIFRSGRY